MKRIQFYMKLAIIVVRFIVKQEEHKNVPSFMLVVQSAVSDV